MFQQFPKQPVAGDFFRIVRALPPQRWDFMSNKERGRTPVGPEIGDDWEHGGLSFFDGFERAARRAQARHGTLGWLIARVAVPADAGVVGRHTGGGHWTLRGPSGADQPSFFLGLVVDVRHAAG